MTEFPKSTAKMNAGDYCVIERSDGNQVLFAYLGNVRGKRSYFYGALLSPAFSSEVSAVPEKMNIDASALVHIKCFAENNTPIVGNSSEAIGEEAIRKAMAAATDMSVGAVHSVWGSRTILRRAEEVAA